MPKINSVSAVVDHLPRRIGSIHAVFFEDGTVELILERPGTPLQAALNRSMGRIVWEAGQAIPPQQAD